MPSGGKELYLTTLERAVSTDILRLQKFANKDRAEYWRFRQNVLLGSDDVTASSALAQITSLQSPVAAEVIGGLTVKPQSGGGVFDLLVDPGVAAFLAPDTALDDSNYKYVNDPGISNVGVLQMTGNSSGSTRIDVVECFWNDNANQETDNRDIFNPLTNSFSPTTVSKAIQGFLNYRVRAGTPGAGFPGTVSGWLPLAVVSVPNGTTANDGMTFWDVRPLVGDRIVPPVNEGRDFPRVFCAGNVNIQGAISTLSAVVEATSSDQFSSPQVPGTYRLGGRIQITDLNAAAVQGTGTPFANPSVVYLYLLEPFGLPRWAQYSAAAPRLPVNPRGIPVVTTVGPSHFHGAPSAAIALPTPLGFAGATTTKGVCVAVLSNTTKIQPVIMDGKAQFTAQLAPVGAGRETPAYAAASVLSASNAWQFLLTDNTTHPANAKALWVVFDLIGNQAANQTGTALIQVSVQFGLTEVPVGFIQRWFTNPGAQINGVPITEMMRIPLWNRYPTFNLPGGVMAVRADMIVNTNWFPSTSIAGTMSVLGWEL